VNNGYSPVNVDIPETDWDVGIEVLPLGIFGKNETA